LKLSLKILYVDLMFLFGLVDCFVDMEYEAGYISS